MVNYKRFNFGTNEGGVTNIVSIGDDGSIVAQDYQSGAVNQVILDECARLRQLTANMPAGSTANPDAQGYIAAKVPITIWTNWRRMWMSKFRGDFTWQTFLVMQLNSRKYRGFKCVDWKIEVPDHVRTIGR